MRARLCVRVCISDLQRSAVGRCGLLQEVEGICIGAWHVAVCDSRTLDVCRQRLSQPTAIARVRLSYCRNYVRDQRVCSPPHSLIAQD